MYRKGHYGASLLAYAPVGCLTIIAGFDVAAVLGGVLTLAIAPLPDYDTQIDTLTHRGVTHTISFAVLTGCLVAVLTTIAVMFADARIASILISIPFGFVIGLTGILSHIAADALTPMGVRPFGEDGTHYSLELVSAKNTIANYLLLVAGIVASFVAIVIGDAIRNIII
ncbi:metal-dependent hydrolase [Haloquadratum walsbyi]|uniref:DUF457 family protein n=1 Tax=Haloquadratum walsbyi (strain DSM 16854 / JCM 12705 / C23) TaxID=768065 RepID=G0LIZ2_HALWC|nr:metal-dependent hydrolase [Haloquadratum walsbyi]CCC40560.1 DUF457 family protein [Haloquadratum walsbyi C23]